MAVAINVENTGEYSKEFDNSTTVSKHEESQSEIDSVTDVGSGAG